MTFLQAGDQILCVASGRVMKALEADRQRANLKVEQLIQRWRPKLVWAAWWMLFFPHLSRFIWSFFCFLVFVSIAIARYSPSSVELLRHMITICRKIKMLIKWIVLCISLVKCWQSSKEIMKQKWVPLCLFSASFQIRTAPTWRQKRGSAVEYAACSYYLVLSDLSLGSSWCRKMICGHGDEQE